MVVCAVSQLFMKRYKHEQLGDQRGMDEAPPSLPHFPQYVACNCKACVYHKRAQKVKTREIECRKQTDLFLGKRPQLVEPEGIP